MAISTVYPGKKCSCFISIKPIQITTDFFYNKERQQLIFPVITWKYAIVKVVYPF